MTEHTDSRVGVVSGGARSIGRGIVEVLLDRDVVDEVVVIDREPEDFGRAEVSVLKADLTQQAEVEEAVEQLPASVSVLVNNVGGGSFQDDFEDPWGPLDVWRTHVELNLTTAFTLTRALSDRLKDGSAICNISSAAAFVGTPGVLHAYGAAKSGISHWTRSLARSLGGQGIRVNAVAPGMVWTSLYEVWIPRAMYDEMVKTTPLGRDQSPQDIGEAVAFLCSDRAANITGVVLPVDGGATIPVIA